MTAAAATNRLQRGWELYKELKQLQFHDAAQALHTQLKQREEQGARNRLLKKSSSVEDTSSEGSEEEEEEEETESSTDSSSSEEDSSEEEASSSSEEESESESESESPSSCATRRRQAQRGFARKVSFSGDDSVIEVSPKRNRPKSMFYSRQDIDRFRLEDRMRKSEEAQAKLEELVSATQSTIMGR